MTERGFDQPASLAEFSVGMRVVHRGRIWAIDAVASTEISLAAPKSRHHTAALPDREDGCIAAVAELVRGIEVENTVWLDAPAAGTFRAFDWKDQVRWAARLKVVNLLDTGYPSGYAAFEEKPLVPALTERDLSGRAAVRILWEWLNGPSAQAQEIRHDLNAQHRRESGVGASLSYDAPSHSSLYRWSRSLHTGGIWEIIDGRSAPRAIKGARAERRTNALQLIDEVLERRTEATSQRDDTWVMHQVRRLADERDLTLPQDTVLRGLVRARHQTSGRTPSQAQTKRLDDRRGQRRVSRPLIPGAMQAWDATAGDVMVRLVPGGVPFRAHVQVAVDVATGAITSIWASGRYSAINVLMLAFDAFRPMTMLPRPLDGDSGRLKAIPHTVFIGKDVETALFKPGAIARKVRADNAKQNYAQALLTTMRRYEVDLSPSQVGIKTQNAHAENAIGIASKLLQEFPAYVGPNTVARGRQVETHDEPMLLEHLNAELHERILLPHNASPCTAPVMRGTGLSRLDAWDELINAYGRIPFIADPREYFFFLCRKRSTLTRKGLAVQGERFDDATLRGLPRHLFDVDRRIDVLYDPRRLEHIWIPDPREGRFYQIQNVLLDYLRGPLVRGVRRAAFERSGLPDTNSAHRRSAFARYAEQVQQETGQHIGIDRDLADWRNAHLVYTETAAKMPADTVVSDVSEDPINPTPTTNSVDLDRWLPTPEMRS